MSKKGHILFIWFCTTVLGLVAALVIIVSLWEKFQTNPTITGLDTDFHNWDVPFPAVTLCQSDPANSSLVNDFVNRTWPDATEDKRAYYREFVMALANISYDSMAALEPYVVSRCEVLVECAYKGELEIECCSYFTPIFTEHGFCFAFNLRFNETEWPYDYNRRDSFTREYIQETDTTWSMAVDTDDAQNNSVSVFIGSSDDLPTLDMAPQHVWTRRISRLSFDAKETYTTDSARQLSIRQRRCVFEDEIALVTDTKYTYSACMRQCRMELAHALCGCLPPFYPLPTRKVKGYKTRFRYCTLKELGCIVKNADKFSTKWINCPCELGCSHTVYEMEKLLEPADPNGDEVSINLEIGFVSWPMQKYKREVLFGWVDLLVAFGGIAGLFLGFSLLSGVEIIYYFTLRACCMVCRDKESLERLAREYEQMEQPKVDLSLRPAFMGPTRPPMALTDSDPQTDAWPPGRGRHHAADPDPVSVAGLDLGYGGFGSKASALPPPLDLVPKGSQAQARGPKGTGTGTTGQRRRAARAASRGVKNAASDWSLPYLP
ncbi:Sodium channel protein Nach [Frankliniella fusca]|uniref:Sodium channel protein Nach n=1 Tax=Frankliniella fusca TaxID=407009 RepID=A0AAE1GZW3_9NEOP|nr:Sodium channel protein Nach [Frankliniella fusca]